jgi:hypothetical protein
MTIVAVALVSILLGAVIAGVVAASVHEKEARDHEALAEKYNAEVETNLRLKACLFSVASGLKDMALQLPYLSKAEILTRIYVLNNEAIACLEAA